MLKKGTGLQGTTLSGYHMTTGFGSFMVTLHIGVRQDRGI